MRTRLPSKQTTRARVRDLLCGQVRSADLVSRIAAMVAADALATIDPATFGLFKNNRGSDVASIALGNVALLDPDQPWTAADVGKPIHVAGAGAAGGVLVTTIASIVSAGEVWLADAAQTAVVAAVNSAGGLAIWGDAITFDTSTASASVLGESRTGSGATGAMKSAGEIDGTAGKVHRILAAIPRRAQVAATITRDGTVVTITVADAAGAKVGNYVTVSGCTETEYNTTWAITGVDLVAKTITFTIGSAPASPATGAPVASWFALLDDANHTPTNVATVTEPDLYTVRVNYGRTYRKIHHVTVAPDDALAPHGLVVGGDVGTAYANLLGFVPLACSFDGGGNGPGLPRLRMVPSLLTRGLSVVNAGDAVRRLTHAATVGNDVPVVTVKAPGAASVPKQVQVAWSATTVDVTAVGPLAGFVSWDGAAFVQALSDNITVPVITWDDVTGTLRVTHANTISDGLPPMVTGHGGVYIPQTSNVAPGYFEVQFFNYAGVKVTGAANANMMFSYMKTRSLVPVTWPDDMEVTVRRGLVPVRVDDYAEVAGNNLWLSGLMEFA